VSSKVDKSHSRKDYARNDAAAREARQGVSVEALEVLGRDAAELLVAADAMGGRALVAERIREVAEAERRGDHGALRAAWMQVSVAALMVVAGMDYQEPREYT
jgi:hypothetical protein